MLLRVHVGLVSLSECSRLITACYSSINDILAADWDRCVPPEHPLLRHANFRALEQSGIACPSTGFSPSHIVLLERGGRIAAIAPAFLKQHSNGELGVDLGLAMAHQRMSGSYYPKLQVEIPMTPFAGGRLLVRPDVSREEAVPALIYALKQRAMEVGASSVQIAAMADTCLLPHLDEADFTVTESNTYVWRAGLDRSFEEFLARMDSASRSEIRRERKRAQAEGVELRRFNGREISAEFPEKFFSLYAENFNRHHGAPWLNTGYFRELFFSMNERLALDVALRGEEWVAAVLTAYDGAAGQVLYWGQSGRAKYLHFEMVMYRSIEHAFATAVSRLDFGSIGAHKAARGLSCTPVSHAMWFRDPAFQPIARVACEGRKKVASRDRAVELARLPFRNVSPESTVYP